MKHNRELIAVIEHLKSTRNIRKDKDIADRLGFSKSVVSNYLSGRVKASDNFLDAFEKEFGVNIMETFENLPYTDAVPIVSEPRGKYNTRHMEYLELPDNRFVMLTPLIQAKAQAGYLTGWGDQEYISELPVHPIVVDKVHRGVYRSFEVSGESMNDGSDKAINDRDVVTGRKIERTHWAGGLHLKKYEEYIIVTYKKGIAIKHIIQHDITTHTITCRSYNPDKEKYPDFVLSLADVMEIYNVVLVTKKR